MALRITHKNTGIKNKEVRRDQLSFGEFAINWHESGPFVQVKDADGTIIRVGGVIIQDEQPALGQKGAFWLSLSKDTLFIYTGDHWHPITGSGAESGGEAPLPPVVNDGTLTIQLADGTVLGTFTANQAGASNVTIPAPAEPDAPTWESIEGKPDCFEPCDHEHPPTPWPDIPEKPDCFPPCDHEHDFPEPIEPNDGKLTIKDSDDNVLGEFTANQDSDTEIVIPAGGGDLDCDGVADCLVKAPVDEPRYAFAIRAGKYDFDWENPPPHYPEGITSVHLYCEICDPDDHHMLELGEEGHGYCAGDRTIFRAPSRFIDSEGVYLAICASPPVYVDDRDAIYGAHPDIIFVKDLRVWKGVYEEGVTTTEELWTTGTEIPAKDDKPESTMPIGDDESYGFLQNDGHILLKTNRCDNFVNAGEAGSYCDGPASEYGWNFYRIEFTCHRGDTYHYAFIFSKHDEHLMGYTKMVNEKMPNIQINPMEDN